MKNKILITLFLFLTIPSLAFAGTFTATVAEPHVAAGESFHLRLRLSDAATSESPDLTELAKSFHILGEEQSTESRYVNGQGSTSRDWDLTLAADGPGQRAIPAIRIGTDSGDLSTEPFTLLVGSGKSATPGRGEGVSIAARVSKKEPYQNERIQVSYEISSNRPLRNVELGELSTENAVVEKYGEPRMVNRLVGGQERQTLVATYLVTPLKAGNITIPALVVRGQVPESRARPARGQTPFGDDFPDGSDPFAQMQRMMDQFGMDDDFLGAFAPLKTVEARSQPILLSVAPPAPGVSPWLPAGNLTLSETWSGKPQAGEPLVRTITIAAQGVSASQLPTLESQLASNPEFKSYEDQPVNSEKVVNGALVSTRKASWTLIPQRSGELRLPPLQVSWWDTNNHVAQTASLPERTFNVLPGALVSGSSHAPLVEASRPETPASPPQSLPASRGLWMLVAGALALASLLWASRRNRTQSIPAPPSASPPESAPSSVPVPRIRRADLQRCETVQDIHRFLKEFSKARLGLAPNSSLRSIFFAAEQRLQDFDTKEPDRVLRELEAALYTDAGVDLPRLRSEIIRLFFSAERAPGERHEDTLPELNPC